MSSPSSLWTEEDARDALQGVVQRAGLDPDFRALCLASPAEAIESHTRRVLPPGFKLRVVDNAGADLTIVLPDPNFSHELSECDLEGVSGGGPKCLVGTCGGTVLCGVTNPCVVASKADFGGKKDTKDKGEDK